MIRKCRLIGITCLILLSSCGGGGEGSEEKLAEENFMGETMIQSGGDPREQIYCEVLEQQAPREDCELISKTAQVTDGSAAFTVPDPMMRGDKTSVTLFVDRRTPQVIDALDAAAEENAIATDNLVDDAIEPASNQAADPDPDASVNASAPEVDITNETAPTNTAAVEPIPGRSQNPTPKQQADKLPGTTDTYDLKVGRRMRADLTGQGFKIDRLSPAVEEIAMDDQGRWSWEVTALQGGKRPMTVTTVVEALVNGRVYELKQTEHPRTVTVDVSIPDQIKDGLRGLPEWLQLIGGALTALAGVAGAWWLVKRNWRSGPSGGKPSGGGTP